MADSFDIKVTDIEEFQRRLKALPLAISKELDMELSDGAHAVAAEAKQRAPADVGFLRQGIGSEKRGPYDYRVYSNAMYSAYVEFGTRTKVSVPAELKTYAMQFIGSKFKTALSAKEAIFAWCLKKGIDRHAWYPIYISIMIKGIKPQPFLWPAYQHLKPIIEARVKKVMEKNVQNIAK